MRLTDGYQSLLVATRLGMADRFDEKRCPCRGWLAGGVKALTLGDGDEVVGMCVCRESGLLLTVTEPATAGSATVGLPDSVSAAARV